MQKSKKIVIFLLIFICMQNLFSFAKEESVVVVLNGDEDSLIISPEEEERKKIYSESAILIEEQTGKILYEKNIYDRKYPASTTKILTAIIALEKCDLNEMATASFRAINDVKPGYTNADIREGETFAIGELIDVMMIVSANEAANIIAEHISGSIENFAILMNQKAKEIGCLDSNFVNPNGMHDDNHYSTAYDLALIARYCMNNEKFREIANKRTCSLPTTEFCDEERTFRNTNSLLLENNQYYYPYCNGIKTGFTTPAKNCLISSSNKDGFETIAVVLHAESTDAGLSARYTDTIKLFEYGYNNYDLQEILEEYDLINYSEEFKPKSFLLSGFIVKDNNTLSKTENNTKSSVIRILLGSFILLLVILYYVVKFIRKNRKFMNSNLYNFKIN